ncbi:MAG: hypothetical protein M0R70_02765 [Nitrospirae bacterium]|nr:hypothetical protein [Nitrospirota bacterium]
MINQLYIERALFVVGLQNTGKSTQLRSMLADPRFGANGRTASSKRIKIIQLSNERNLYIRLSSPHESRLTPQKFIRGIQSRMRAGRWCFAGALHPKPLNKMPDAAESIALFQDKFNVERIRVCFLSPDKRGQWLNENEEIRIEGLLRHLRKIGNVECMFIDARSRKANSLLLSDFFDFS